MTATTAAVIAAVGPLAALTALIALWQVRARRRWPDLDVPPELADELAPRRLHHDGHRHRPDDGDRPDPLFDGPAPPDRATVRDSYEGRRWL